MAENTQAIAVDMQAISAEISKLSPSQIAEQLTKVRVRQKVQQKKQYAKGGMKTYQAKQREKFKQMKEQALATPSEVVDPKTGAVYPNLWAQVNAQAESAAEAKLMDEAEVPEEGEDEAEATHAS
jgi:hypothetical protein